MYRRAFLSTWDADDDLAFFSKDTKPQPAEEWAKVLAWVRGAEPSVLWRWEPMRGPGGYEDPTGERVRSVSAVEQNGHELYLGNLHGNHVSVLKLTDDEL